MVENAAKTPNPPVPSGDPDDPSGNTEQFRAFLHGTPEAEASSRRTSLLVTLGVLGVLVLAAVLWLVLTS